jgi:hypothetical protein
MNRSAKDGAWSSPHYGGEGTWVHSVAPRCLRTTRWGRALVTQGGLVSSKRRGMAGIVRHSQTKGRANGERKTQPGATREVGTDISASEILIDAVPGVGSGRGTLERGQNKRPRIVIIEWRRRSGPKGRSEGEGPVL